MTERPRHSYTEAARALAAGLDREAHNRAVSRQAQHDEAQRRAAEWLAAKTEAEAAATRIARCGCGREEPSTPFLAFRETAEKHAEGRCAICGYAEVAHSPETLKTWRERGVVPKFAGHEFVQAEPRDYDTFYCGCRGWD